MIFDTWRIALTEIVELAGRHRIVPLGCTPNGYGPTEQGLPWTDHHVEMVELCRAFIRAANRPRWRRPQSSYFLKHQVEDWQRVRDLSLDACHYVTNGSLVVACLAEGLKPRRMWFEDRGRRLAINAKVHLP